MHNILPIIAGIILLLFGRTLFWLFVGVAGFLFGLEIAPQLFHLESTAMTYLVALSVGIVSAILAIFLQRLAFALGGFFAGGYVGSILAEQLQAGLAEQSQTGDSFTIWYVVGGVIGALFAALLMDWAIIILSSMVGAVAIVDGFGIHGGSVGLILLLVLLLAGCIFQGRSYEGRPADI